MEAELPEEEVLLQLRGAGSPAATGLGDQEAGERFRLKQRGGTGNGALGDTGLLGALRHWLAKKDNGADKLAGTLLGPAERLLSKFP